MVAGDVVNTASRLQSAAPVNGVIVGRETYATTREAIEYEPADPIQAKGKAEPVEAWLALETAAPLVFAAGNDPANHIAYFHQPCSVRLNTPNLRVFGGRVTIGRK